MADKTIIIHISGYWRDQHKINMLTSSGVFFVYEAKFNESDQTVDLLKLIYIGEAANIRARIFDHESYPVWQRHLSSGNELCYAYAPVDSCYRERVKAAYIITHKPPANANLEDPFVFDKTTLVSTGRTALINPVITVRKNSSIYPGGAMFLKRNDMIPVRTVQVFNRSYAGRRYAIGG